MKPKKPADKLFLDFIKHTKAIKYEHKNYEQYSQTYNKAEDGLHYTEGYASQKDYEESNS